MDNKDQRNSGNRGPVGTEDQRTSRYRGPKGIEDQWVRGPVYTVDLRNSR